MENQKLKCSLKKHNENEAVLYCQECKIYLCKNCEKLHSELFEDHNLYSLDKDIKEIFTGFCKEVNHFQKLEYYCQNHNQLCCAACISKIKGNGNGQHTDCNVCFIEEIKKEMKNKLKENIKSLEDLSILFQNLINELKLISEKISESREELKIKIQKIFTKIRNEINNREDIILSKIDENFNNLFKEEILKESEKLPKKIKISLDKGKNLDNEWTDNSKLNEIINECITIENNIVQINKINENIKKCNISDISKIKFYPEKEEEINIFLNHIKTFGEIYFNNFSFRVCPNDINEFKKYEISGKEKNILTKTGEKEEKVKLLYMGDHPSWAGAICESELKKDITYKWKIKILKTINYKIMIGVTPSDFNIKSSNPNNCGWYYYCSNSGLYSGPPHNYRNKNTNIKKKKDEIIVMMNMKKRALKFIIDNEDYGDSYIDIPIDKPLFPVVFLLDKNDSIEITEC